MNEKAAIFKPDDVIIDFEDGTKIRLLFDLNAFCELETIYDSVDTVIQMVLGQQENVDVNALLTQVKCGDQFIEGKDVTIAGTPLVEYLNKVHLRKSKHEDTLNLLWAGALHDNAVYNEHDELTGYTISKHKLGQLVTFKNLREVNAKIIVALLRDLIPVKNADEPEMEQETSAQETIKEEAPKLHLPKTSEM